MKAQEAETVLMERIATALELMVEKLGAIEARLEDLTYEIINGGGECQDECSESCSEECDEACSEETSVKVQIGSFGKSGGCSSGGHGGCHS